MSLVRQTALTTTLRPKFDKVVKFSTLIFILGKSDPIDARLLMDHFCRKAENLK